MAVENGARSEVALAAAYMDLRSVMKILASGVAAERKCKNAAAAVDRLVRWVKDAGLQTAVEMLEISLQEGVFEPAERNENGEVTTTAVLKPHARRGAAFCQGLSDAAEQCVETMVVQLGFKVPELPAQSGASQRGSEKRDREDNDENEEEEAVQEELFEDQEDAVGPRPASKKGKGDAGVTPENLERDEELKRRMDAFLMSRVPGYAPAAGKGNSSEFALREPPCAKMRKQIVADPVSGEMKSVSVPRLPKAQFLAQNMKMVEKFSDEKEREHFLNYISWIVSLDSRYAWSDLYDFDTQVREDWIAGRLKSWDPIQLGFRFQYSFLETLGESGRRLLDDKGARGGKGGRDDRDKGRDNRDKGGKGKKDLVCDFFQLARGCKKGKDCGFIHSCRNCKSAAHGASTCDK